MSNDKYVLVPRQMTDEMVAAFFESSHPRDCWEGILAVAPAAPAPQEGGREDVPAAGELPANCRARLMHEGKPYARSSCSVCGHFSPRHKECTAAIAAHPAQGE